MAYLFSVILILLTLVSGCKDINSITTTDELTNSIILDEQKKKLPENEITAPANCKQNIDFKYAVQNAVDVTPGTPITINNASEYYNCVFRIANTTPDNYKITVTPGSNVSLELDLARTNNAIIDPAQMNDSAYTPSPRDYFIKRSTLIAPPEGDIQNIYTAFLATNTDFTYFWIYILGSSSCDKEKCSFTVDIAPEPAYVFETREVTNHSQGAADTVMTLYYDDDGLPGTAPVLYTNCIDDDAHNDTAIFGDGTDSNSGSDNLYSRIICHKASMVGSKTYYIKVKPEGSPLIEGAYMLYILDTSDASNAGMLCTSVDVAAIPYTETIDNNNLKDFFEDVDDGFTSLDANHQFTEFLTNGTDDCADAKYRTVQASDNDWFFFALP